jgi:hypothetical protein
VIGSDFDAVGCHLFLVILCLFINFIQPAFAIDSISEEDQGVLKTETIIAGIMIAGEATALYIGMQSDPTWLCTKNNILLITDLITGSGLIYLAVTRDNLADSRGFYFLSTIALVAHGYREWEYIHGADQQFCFNIPLFIVNNIKIIGLASIINKGLIITYRF